jgi:hypothetical protein
MIHAIGWGVVIGAAAAYRENLVLQVSILTTKLEVERHERQGMMSAARIISRELADARRELALAHQSLGVALIDATIFRERIEAALRAGGTP